MRPHSFPRDEYFMRLALREAERALEHDDVPIGAVVVHEGEVIGAGRNERELRQDPTAHAETIALREAARGLVSWRLAASGISVTLEPCAVGAGPVGLLETVGARSGIPRSTPLLYMEHEGRIVLVASKAGAQRHPAWFHNLSAHPEVGFTGRYGRHSRYTAREAEGAERDALWAQVNDLYAGYEDY